jgi:hypothetical protein
MRTAARRFVLLAALLAPPLAGQAVERTDTPRAGSLRATFDPRIMTWERIYLPGGRQFLGAGLTGDSVGAAIPSIATLQSNVRTLTGLSGYLASLGKGLLGIRAERRTMPIALELGITNRLSVSLSVPIVRVQVRKHLQLDSTEANLGLNPLLANPVDSTTYNAFFAALGGALQELSDSITGGHYGCPGSAQCIQAQALLARGQALQTGLFRMLHPLLGEPPVLFLPRTGSDAGHAIDSLVSGVGQDLTGFNIASFAQTFELPADPASATNVSAVLSNPDFGYGIRPFVDTPRRLRFFTGDVEVSTKYRVVESRNYAAAVGVLVRLPTGHQASANDPFDISTGDHQTDVEGQLIQELTLWQHLWLNLNIRAGMQLAGYRERRLAPFGETFALGPPLRFRWDPGDYLAVDVAPMMRLSQTFAAGFTAGYYTQGADHYSNTAASPTFIPAAVLDAGTAERRLRLGVAWTYTGPTMEGGFSIEQTVSGAGAPVPVATVFRIVIRVTKPLF